MDQNPNDNLFENDNPNPQQPSEPTQIGGGARIYQTPPGAVPEEPRPYTPPPSQPAYTPPPNMGQPPIQPPKKNNNTIWIIVVVVVLLLCCCCLVAAGIWLWNNGDSFLQDLSMLPMLSLLV